MPSFDIVSKLDLHELTNAIDQANRELANRFDFKGTGAEFERSEETVVILKAQAEFQLKQMLDIFKQRLASRHIDIRCAEIADPEINLATARQKVTLKQGIEQPVAKDIIRRIKDAKLKVEVQIQGDKLRATAKKRDDLQAAIALLRGAADIKLPLQYENFRD